MKLQKKGAPNIVDENIQRTPFSEHGVGEEGEQSLGHLEHCNTKEQEDQPSLYPLFLALYYEWV